MERDKAVTGVALAKDQAKVVIRDVPDRPGIAAQIFSALGKNKINVDMIVQATQKDGTNSITFTVNEDDLQSTLTVAKDVGKELGAPKIEHDAKVCKISIVGVGMISQPGVAAQMFQTLADAGINIELISTSEIKVSCVIRDEHGAKAVQLLHKVFELDAAPVAKLV